MTMPDVSRPEWGLLAMLCILLVGMFATWPPKDREK